MGKGRWGFEQVRKEVAYGKVHGVSVEGVEKCVREVRREVWGKVKEGVGCEEAGIGVVEYMG